LLDLFGGKFLGHGGTHSGMRGNSNPVFRQGSNHWIVPPELYLSPAGLLSQTYPEKEYAP